jgi:Na+-translocating ferredoxin:NAD+ oxidoreductase RNF subunit RnfB
MYNAYTTYDYANCDQIGFNGCIRCMKSIDMQKEYGTTSNQCTPA